MSLRPAELPDATVPMGRRSFRERAAVFKVFIGHLV